MMGIPINQSQTAHSQESKSTDENNNSKVQNTEQKPIPSQIEA